jgi:asparagine N-glycosylation enzyme membrane subunit Stt3
VLAIPVPMQLLPVVWARASKGESLFVFCIAAALVVSVATEIVDRKLVAATVMLVASFRFALTGVSGLAHAAAWATAAGVAGFVLAGGVRRSVLDRAAKRAQPPVAGSRSRT